MNILVTGATAGFGAAISELFVSKGHKVVGAGRREDRLADLAVRLGSGFHPLVLDVGDVASISNRLAAMPAEFAGIDVLVNNAGVAKGLESAQEALLEDWLEMISTNCTGLVAVTHAVLPGMVERGQGHVINIGSVAGRYAYPGGNVYGASKAFVHQFSMNLRADLHGTGIRVTALEPGLGTGTEFSKIRFRGDEVRASKRYEGVEALTPQDIAAAVEWVASLPSHVNVNFMEIMPVAQSFAPLPIHRRA